MFVLLVCFALFCLFVCLFRCFFAGSAFLLFRSSNLCQKLQSAGRDGLGLGRLLKRVHIDKT